MLLLLSLHWVIDPDTSVENVDFSLGEQRDLWQESRVRVLERIREEETQDDTAENGEGTH